MNAIGTKHSCIYQGVLLAVKFVSADKAADTGANPTSKEVAAGALCRTPEFMMNLVRECGGRSMLVYDAKVDNKVVNGVHILHIFREL